MAVHGGQQQVKDDQVEALGEGPPQPFLAALRQLDRKTLGGKRTAEAGAYRLFIVDEQDARPGSGVVLVIRAARFLSRDHGALTGATGAVPVRSRPFRRNSGGNSHPGTATEDAMSTGPLCK